MVYLCRGMVKELFVVVGLYFICVLILHIQFWFCTPLKMKIVKVKIRVQKSQERYERVMQVETEAQQLTSKPLQECQKSEKSHPPPPNVSQLSQKIVGNHPNLSRPEKKLSTRSEPEKHHYLKRTSFRVRRSEKISSCAQFFLQVCTSKGGRKVIWL